MSNLHHDSLPPRRSLPLQPPQRPSLAPMPVTPEQRVVAGECLEIARLLRQGYDAEALGPLERLCQRFSPLGESLSPPQRRLLLALLPPLQRYLRGGDGIGLSDLLEHRIAPLLLGGRESAP